MRITLNDQLMVESLGEEVLVFDSKSAQVARFSGEQADLIRTLSGGQSVDIAPSRTLQQLLDTGVVVQAGLFSRRKALTLGAGAVGLGAVSLLMPTAAMAQSNVSSAEFGFTISAAIIESGGDFSVGLKGTVENTIQEFQLSTGTGPFAIVASTTDIVVVGDNFVDLDVTFANPSVDLLDDLKDDGFSLRWSDGAVISLAITGQVGRDNRPE